MTTTPEQLAKYRKDFEKTEFSSHLEKTALGMYAVTSIENRWQGYLRRCQETEQAIKDARKQALEEVLAIWREAQELKDVKRGLHELLEATK